MFACVRRIIARSQPSQDQKKFSKTIGSITGFQPKNLAIYRLALRHKSVSECVHVNNERLEFLGDTILDAVVADILYRQFPNHDEGFLTKQKANLVKRKHLNEMAHKIGLAQQLFYTLSGNHCKNIFGNALEALIGAIYLDLGYEKTYSFIQHQLLSPFVNMEHLITKESDPKSKIIEWGQKNKAPIAFDTHEKYEENKNSPTFVSFIRINDETIGKGEGHSKKEAEQEASAIGLHKITSATDFNE